MPAWTEGQAESFIGIKAIAIFPTNLAKGIPSLTGSYLLLSGRTGQPLASIDGPMLTVRRTACASALAARYLARTDADSLLLVGTGALAPFMARAHCALRPGLRRVLVWGRDAARAAGPRRSPVGSAE